MTDTMWFRRRKNKRNDDKTTIVRKWNGEEMWERQREKKNDKVEIQINNHISFELSICDLIPKIENIPWICSSSDSSFLHILIGPIDLCCERKRKWIFTWMEKRIWKSKKSSKEKKQKFLPGETLITLSNFYIYSRMTNDGDRDRDRDILW